MKKYILIFLLLSILQACDKSDKIKEQKVVGTIAKNGMVVTAHPLASKVGLEILKKGGNAFDAAIAVQYALAVVLPKAGNIGGGGFMVYRTHNGDKGALDFREKAPMKGHRDMYLDEDGEVIEDLSRKGHLAAGVPGTVAGMDETYKKFATLPFKDLIQPAIELAANGYTLSQYGASILNRFQEDFIENNTHSIHLVREKLYSEGDSVFYKDLSKTLERIKKFGRDGFYKGETAELIEKEMIKGGGFINKEDLAAYQATWRTPLIGSFKEDYTVISMPPSSSGGVVLLQLMEGSEMFDFKKMGHNTVQSIHIMTELQRRVYADRSTHLGDMDFYDVPLNMLLDSSYIHERMSTISIDTATPSQLIKEGEVEKIESFETTHFSIVDKEGNAVSITTTLNSFFGCKVMVEEAGFFLNNEMDDFSAKPGVPNQFGLVGGEANAIEPQKRMLSSMTPTIIEKNGQLHMVLGTPGGSTIMTNVYQVVMNVLEYEMNMQEAVNAKKMHSQWLPDLINLEDSLLTVEEIEQLKAKGHQIKQVGNIGRIEAILKRNDGTYEGAADKNRLGDATALGY